MNEFQQALTDRLAAQANKRVVQEVERLLSEGGRWINDPNVANVFGLLPADANEVVVILYLADPNAFCPRPMDDFELSGDFERSLV